MDRYLMVINWGSEGFHVKEFDEKAEALKYYEKIYYNFYNEPYLQIFLSKIINEEFIG